MAVMVRQAVEILLVAYIPGALIFRLPLAGRPRRTSLPAEERLFWHIVLSVAFTSIVALGLAASAQYRFERVLWVNAAAAALTLLAVTERAGRLPAPRAVAADTCLRSCRCSALVARPHRESAVTAERVPAPPRRPAPWPR